MPCLLSLLAVVPLSLPSAQTLTLAHGTPAIAAVLLHAEPRRRGQSSRLDSLSLLVQGIDGGRSASSAPWSSSPRPAELVVEAHRRCGPPPTQPSTGTLLG